MKKHLTILLLLGIFALFIQCKPATENKAAADEPIEETLATEESESEAEPETIAGEPEAVAEAEKKAEPETKAKSEPIAKTEAKPEPKPEVKPEQKTAPEPEKKTEDPVAAPAPEKKVEKETKAPEPAPAAPVTSSFSLKSPKGVIEGSSNLHDWKIDVTKMECKGSFQSVDNVVKAVKNVEVKIPVLELKSEKGKTMDQKTYEAFNSDKHPHITFAFSSADVKTDASGAVTIAASGSLSMAGKTKTVPVTAKGKTLANGDLQLSIIQKLKMSEFDMKSPTALMGTIKVGDEVTVRFDIVLAR
jgi:polyisoprenoid-binding protein YceI